LLRHFRPQGLVHRLSHLWTKTLDTLLLDQSFDPVGQAQLDLHQPEVEAFFARQVHIATEGFGDIDPLDLDEYVAQGGFTALARCLGMPLPGSAAVTKSNSRELFGGTPALAGKADGFLSPQQLIDLIENSGLRGRGGAGFSTGAKWRAARQQPGEIKYVICN